MKPIVMPQREYKICYLFEHILFGSLRKKSMWRNEGPIEKDNEYWAVNNEGKIKDYFF
jgi:hypothetical protein